MTLVNPVHFFTERGVSALTYDHLVAENARLEAENEELKRRNKTLTLRLRAIAAGDQGEGESLNS